MARTVDSVVTEKKDSSTNGGAETNARESSGGEQSRPKAGPASKTGRKRNSSETSDIEEGSSSAESGKMKKARTGSPAIGDPKLVPRIKKYLEENRNQKFIDIEGMASALHVIYPEYQRKKLRQFRIQVDSAFKSIRDNVVRQQVSKNKKTEPLQAVSSDENEVMDADAAQTVIKGKLNSTLTNMYGGKNDKSAVNTPSKSNEECVIVDKQQKNGGVRGGKSGEDIIDIDDDVENGDKDVELSMVSSETVDARKKIGTPLNVSTPNSFEETKEKARQLAESLSKKKSSAAKKAPSKNLSSFMNKSNVSGEKDPDVEEVVEQPSNSNDAGTPQKIQSRKSSSNRSSSDKVSSRKKPKEVFEISSVLDHTVSTPSDSSLQPCSTRKIVNNVTAVNGEQDANETIESVDIDKSRSDSASTPAKDLASRLGVKRPDASASKRPINEAWMTKRRKKEATPVALQESSVTFSDFGGNDAMLCEVCKLLVHLKHPEVYLKLGVTPPRGFLLHGPPGCGKTLLAHAIAGELQLPFIKVAAPEVVSGVSGDSESKIRDLFEQAAASAPCVLFIDEIDSITPKRENAQKEMERRIVAQLLSCMDDLGKKDCQVVVIGATNRPDALDPALRRAGRFDREIAIGIPDQKARRKILDVLLRGLRLSPNTDLEELASLTPGYVGADLASLAREAAISAVNRVFGDQVAGRLSGSSVGDTATPLCKTDSNMSQLSVMLEWLQDTPPLAGEQLEQLFIEKGDWKEALSLVQPSAKREGFATVPDVTWDDVGALKNIREELQLAILAPIRHVAAYQSLGLNAPAGVLLAGPPGCGKTLVAKAVANEAGINFISVKGPELLNMYVGESERAVRACFQRGRNSAPCVIFFDELDSLCPRRSGNSSDGGSSSRVVNQLLTEMDGVESRKGVFLMAATNRPDILDPAVLRPGRLDKILYVGFPTPPDRTDILKALTKNGTKPSLEPDVDLAEIGLDERCEGFSGADMSALVREASMSALKQHLRWKSTNPIVVAKSHFNEAFRRVRPSVSGKDRQKYDAMKVQYGSEDGGKIKYMKAVEKKSRSQSQSVPVTKSPNSDSGGAKKRGGENTVDEICLDEDEDVVMEIGPTKGGPICNSDSIERNTPVENDETVPAENVQNVLDASPKQVHEIEVPNQRVRRAPIPNKTVPEKSKATQLEVVEKELTTEDEHMEIDIVNERLSKDGEYVSSENVDTNSQVGEKNDLKVPETDAAKGLEVNFGASSKIRLSGGLESASDISDDDLKDDETSLSSEDEGGNLRKCGKKQVHHITDDLSKCDKKVEEVIELDTEDSNDSVPFLPPPVSAIMKSNGDKKQIGNLAVHSDVEKENDVSLDVEKVTDKDSDESKTVDSNKTDSSTPRDGLRFLTGMEIRVKDKCKVPQVAGKTGFVLATGCKNDQVSVMLKDKGEKLVPSIDLEPFIPEEGDKAKCLQWGHREDVAEVVSVDEDEDTAVVRYGEDKATDTTMQLDHLCRIGDNIAV